MSPKLRKILIVLITFLIIVLIGLLVYSILFKNPFEKERAEGQLPEVEEGEFQPEEGLEETGPSPELKVRAISKERVLAPTLSSDKLKVIYYSPIDGLLWESSFDGTGLTQVTQEPIKNLFDVIWSPNKKEIISVHYNPDETVLKYYRGLETGAQSFLNSKRREISFSPDGKKIVYQFFDESTGENYISIADPTGANWQNLAQIKIKEVNLDWGEAGISFYEKSSGLTPSSLFLLNPLTKSITKVLSEIYGFSAKWSPQGDKILFSKTNDKGKNIYLYVASKEGVEQTPIGPGLVEKCVWSNDNRTLYCAVPKNIDSAEVLPDDFYKGKFISNDEFWKINTETGEKINLLENERIDYEFDAVSPFLSPLEDYLFFVNKNDGLLYSIEL